MNKIQYLEQLEKILEAHQVVKEDVLSILADYEELFDQGLAKNLSNEAIIHQIGAPETVYEQLKHDLRFKHNPANKMVALMPFIAIIAFFLIGQLVNAWQYAWMAFLSIPIVAIIINTKGKNKWIALSPFVSVIAFLYVGLAHGLWHPGWIALLLTPMLSILLSGKLKDGVVGMSPFAALVAVTFWTYTKPSDWQYAWLLFLIMPILGYLFAKQIKRQVLGTMSIIAAIVLYVALIVLKVEIGYALLSFLLPLTYAIWQGDIKLHIEFIDMRLKSNRIYLSLMMLVIVAYFVVSFTTNTWSYSWVIWLLIPCILIFKEQKFKHLVAYMPFLATILFVVGGNIFGYWQYLWMIYLLIPMTAIIQDKGKTVTITKKNVIDVEYTDKHDEA